MVFNAVTATASVATTTAVTTAKKRQSIDNSMIRFPKLDECAHFHYETAELDDFLVSLINNDHGQQQQLLHTDIQNVHIFVRVQCANRSWTVRRDLRDFSFLDTQLHKCVFDRQHSKLMKLDMDWFSSVDNLESILYHIDKYLERLPKIVGTSLLTCGPILHWFEMDNHGNRLINEESDINTPAIGAAFVIKKHCKKNVETEISLEIGELISVIEMPPLNESFYWKGKKGFEVGFFPAECVQLIDDKISRKSEELSLRPLKKCVSPTLCHRPFDLNISFSDSEDHGDNPTEAAIRKRSKISVLFRNFVAGIRMRRRDQLKRSGILKERVFGCDLCEHLENSGHEYPLVLTACCSYIEIHGLNTNGIYRISGVVSTINRLRTIFDEDRIPHELIEDSTPCSDENSEPLDIHAVSSLLKLYFRELPNPLLTYSLFDAFIGTMRDESLNEKERLKSIRKLVRRLPPPHWRTLRLLIRHLALISEFHSQTGMTSKNIAIVWAPNLLRTKNLDLGKEALQIVTTQAVLTEFLIINCDKIFDQKEYQDMQPSRSLYLSFVHSKEHYQKSPPLSSKCLKYIDVGPEIIPGKYHTVITYRPSQSKRSKFNLQNFKFHNFFTARNSLGTRHRPSLRALHNHHHHHHHQNNNGERKDRMTSDDDDSGGGGGGSGLNSSQSMKYTISFQSKILCCSNKQMKRSHSFDSYFKKMKTGDFHHHHQHGDNINNNDTTRDLSKIETSIYPSLSDQEHKKFNPHHHIITNETIFEIEEKVLADSTNKENFQQQKQVREDNQSFSQYVNNHKNFEKKSKCLQDMTTIEMMTSDNDDEDKENDTTQKSNSFVLNHQQQENVSNSLSLPSTSIFDLYSTTTTPKYNTPTVEIPNLVLVDRKNIDTIHYQKLPVIASDTITKHRSDVVGSKYLIDTDCEKIEKIKEERRKKFQQRFQPILGENQNNIKTDDQLNNMLPAAIRSRLYNSTQKLNPSSMELPIKVQPLDMISNASMVPERDRYKLGRSMPTMSFTFASNNNDNSKDNISPTSVHKKPQSIMTTTMTTTTTTTTKITTPTTKITITPLRTVNKRQRIIYDEKNELNRFLKNENI